jgi:hypothetical protein
LDWTGTGILCLFRVVDEFSFKNIDFDGDQRNIADTYMGEISHGEAVVAHIKTILPGAQIIQLNSGNYEVFNELSRLKARGKQIDAVNAEWFPVF